MNLIFILLVWLFVAFITGVLFGKFCAVGNRSDALYPSKCKIESDTLANNLTPTEGSFKRAA
jgi:hypothetical protein